MDNKKKKLILLLLVIALGLVPGLFIGGNNFISESIKGLPDISWKEKEIVINESLLPESVLEVEDIDTEEDDIVIEVEDDTEEDDIVIEDEEEHIILTAIEESKDDLKEILTTPIKDVPNKFYETVEENKGLITLLSAITTGVIIIVVIASKSIVLV